MRNKKHEFVNVNKHCKMFLGKLSKKKNYETYGIFHMLVDPPLHMEKNHNIFLVLKCFSDTSMTFLFFPLVRPKILRKFSSIWWGGGHKGKK